jgi:hypothetical protein
MNLNVDPRSFAINTRSRVSMGVTQTFRERSFECFELSDKLREPTVRIPGQFPPCSPDWRQCLECVERRVNSLPPASLHFRPLHDFCKVDYRFYVQAELRLILTGLPLVGRRNRLYLGVFAAVRHIPRHSRQVVSS